MDANPNPTSQSGSSVLSLRDNTLTISTPTSPRSRVPNSALLGQFISSKIVAKTLIYHILSKAWNNRKPWSMIEPSRKTKNTFVFLFESEDDKRNVLEHRPWTVKGNLLVLNEWDSDTPMQQLDFKMTSIWVQAHGVPPRLVTIENAMQIATVVGKVITLEFDATNARWSEYLRFKVQVDLTKPLKAGIFLPVKDKHHAWVQFKFEKLGDFCYKCRRIGHDWTLCNENETSQLNL
ncbi:hypothetical protein UlMin_002553 [Ulmus minor]